MPPRRHAATGRLVTRHYQTYNCHPPTWDTWASMACNCSSGRGPDVRLHTAGMRRVAARVNMFVSGLA